MKSFLKLRLLALSAIMLCICWLMANPTAQAQDLPRPNNPQSIAQPGQTLTQTIRGTITDQQSKTPIGGVRITLADSTLKLGTLSDDEGRFELKGVPVGRQTVIISMVGYEARVIANLLITTGKEVLLAIDLQEQVSTQAEIVITDERDRTIGGNELASVSSRSMDSELTARYAGSLNDPSRMAANFAGVSQSGDTRNDIIVRGNSPTGLLWRYEGVDVYNPNHFALQGSNGGPISMLNNNVLGVSDFMTGAFPAEYSNATAGAFDIKMRLGNPNKRETMFMVGFNGFELMTEGPISRESQSTYLVSYRYSTLAVFDALGIKFGDLLGIPFFQDLSFKVNFPTKKAGTFSVFGVGGLNNIDILESELTEKEFTDPETRLSYQDIRVRGGSGATGLGHTILLNSKSHIKTTLAATGAFRRLDVDSLNPQRAKFPELFQDSDDYKIILTSALHYKFNSRHFVKVGFFLDQINSKVSDCTFVRELGRFHTLRNFDEQTLFTRLYASYQYRLTAGLTLNTGLTYQHLAFNQTQNIEPRIGLRWRFLPEHTISGAYGIHNQMQPFVLYFYRNLQGQENNRNLDFTRSQHLVMSYDWTPTADWRLKVEGYYQMLDQVPVERTPSVFSALNISGADNSATLDTDNLVNNGTGYNYGAEITIEKSLTRNYYMLLTTSIFDSRYKGSDGIERNTVYNTGYVVNALVGGEYPLTADKKHNLFTDIRLATAGGVRYTPIDMERSQAELRTVYIDSRANTLQATPYFRLDVKFGYRINMRKISQEFYILIQNITNQQNVLLQQYDLRSNSMIERYQLGLFPVFQYKINF
jgi:hypothetical protein